MSGSGSKIAFTPHSLPLHRPGTEATPSRLEPEPDMGFYSNMARRFSKETPADLLPPASVPAAPSASAPTAPPLEELPAIPPVTVTPPPTLPPTPAPAHQPEQREEIR